MNISEQLFPFDKVPKGSRVILYGLGVLGRQYLRQIEQLHWCTIVGGMDRSARAEDWEIPILTFEDVEAMPADFYDCIVIAISSLTIAQTVKEDLMQHGVAGERVFSLADRETGEAEDDATDDGTPLKVLLYLTGGIGDGVTDLAIYARLVELVPDVIIDIYGEPFIRFLYKQKENVRNIFDYHRTTKMPEGYDLVLRGSWYLSVTSCNHKRLKIYAPELDDLVRKTELHEKEVKTIGTLVHRSILRGGGIWAMSHEGIWGLTTSKIQIDFDVDYADQYKKLGLKKYITVNCGVDMRRMESGDIPTKIWPAEYFEEWIAMFKKEYPEYEVIQLGAKSQAKLKQADRNLLGEPFELVTYILKGSCLHIDDEGGLVHLATALGTKCVVLFGPTRPDFFGYPQNINISTGVCPSCGYDILEWNKNCFRGAKRPPCMYSILPEIVMEHVAAYLEGLRGDAL